MSDIEQLHQRISAAMDRVAYGLTQMDAMGNAGEVAALQAQLDEEKTVTAQLEARVAAMKDKLEAQATAHDAAFAELQGRMEALDTEAQKLRASNDALREANQALREANAAGVGEPHLINSSVMAELESLRAARELERAEADAILTALAPALAENKEQADA